jgi:hypothetical protein
VNAVPDSDTDDDPRTYDGLLSTLRALDPGVHDRLLAAIITVIDDRFGGRITIDWSAQCYKARRL